MWSWMMEIYKSTYWNHNMLEKVLQFSLTNSYEEIYFCEDNRRSAGEDIPCLLQNPKLFNL
jgi:hypothetical protein